MAMNALYREGVPLNLSAATDAKLYPGNESQSRKKRKALAALSETEDRRVSSRTKKDFASRKREYQTFGSGVTYKRLNQNEVDHAGIVLESKTEPKLGSKRSDSTRTRAGLAKVLKGVVQPKQRVDGKSRAYPEG
jgi:hypothetical protein